MSGVSSPKTFDRYRIWPAAAILSDCLSLLESCGKIRPIPDTVRPSEAMLLPMPDGLCRVGSVT